MCKRPRKAFKRVFNPGSEALSCWSGGCSASVAMTATSDSKAVWSKPVKLPVSSGVPLAAVNEIGRSWGSRGRNVQKTEFTLKGVPFLGGLWREGKDGAHRQRVRCSPRHRAPEHLGFEDCRLTHVRIADRIGVFPHRRSVRQDGFSRDVGGNGSLICDGRRRIVLRDAAAQRGAKRHDSQDTHDEIPRC